MEDSHIANTNIGNGLALFGVFDGHGGKLKNFLFNLSLKVKRLLFM